MNCPDYRHAVHAYARAELSAADVARVEKHMHECPHCQKFNEVCRELTCRDFVEFLDEYVDQTLTAERRAIFERHMTVCPDCVNYLESYRQTIALNRAARDEEEQAQQNQIPDQLIQAILAARRGELNDPGDQERAPE